MMTNPPPGAVYEITDAAPPRTASAAPSLTLRLVCRTMLAVAALLLVRLLLPASAPWWAYAALCGWTAWPWLAPRLRRAGAVALLVLGALDALVAAVLGTRRLAYLYAVLRQAVREPAPGTASTDNPDRDDAPCHEGDAS